MIRRLSTAAAALLLLICVATIVLWVRSYCTWDEIGVRSIRWDRGPWDDTVGFSYHDWEVVSGWTRGEIYVRESRGRGVALTFGTYTPAQSMKDHPEGVHFTWQPDGAPIPLKTSSYMPVEHWWCGFSYWANSPGEDAALILVAPIGPCLQFSAFCQRLGASANTPEFPGDRSGGSAAPAITTCGPALVDALSAARRSLPR